MALRRLCALLAIIVVGCSSTVTPAPSTNPNQGPNPSTEPSVSAAPGDSGDPTVSPGPDPGGGPPSSQALIATDLASGAIDEATALRYRAWALFWDPRLPERYDGAGSTGLDESLFDDIADRAPSLEGDIRAELESYLLRPTDPGSPFSGGGTAGGLGATLLSSTGRAPRPPEAAASPSPPPTDQCEDSIIDRHWFWDDWTPPGGSADTGFRAWVCDVDEVSAQPDLTKALAAAAKLWEPMTKAMPTGMGLPYPDTGSDVDDGSGKIDLYILDPTAPCRQRGSSCKPIPGLAVAMAPRDDPQDCGRHGYPASGCSGYMLLGRSRLGSADFAADFAHEFFHRLQQSHNGKLGPIWYTEASAVWAEYNFVARSGAFSAPERAAAFDSAFGFTRWFQFQGTSLLYWEPSARALNPEPQYRAWTWPLFQAVKDAPASVFLAWKAMESATTEPAMDDAVDAQLSFVDNFRDFAVWNAQPSDYLPNGGSTGLDPVRWQTKDAPHLQGYPTDRHHLDGQIQEVTATSQFEPVNVEALDAWYQRLTIAADVREITIDITNVANASNADLDLIVHLNAPTEDTPGDPWRRIREGHKVTLCRDNPDENASMIEVVISNHSHQRDAGDKPAAAATVKDAYQITGDTACHVPDHYVGTIGGSNSRGDSWTGTASFDLIRIPDPRGGCSLGTYCYTFVSGSATWTCPSGSTVHVSLSPPDNGGSIQLIISDPYFPDNNRTYTALIGASSEEKCPAPPPQADYIAELTVVGWLQVVGEPKIGADWTLADSYSNSGCGIEGVCGTQSWNWNLQPIFDP